MRNIFTIGTIAVLLGAFAGVVASGRDTSTTVKRRQLVRFTRTLDTAAAGRATTPTKDSRRGGRRTATPDATRTPSHGGTTAHEQNRTDATGPEDVDLQTILDPGFPLRAPVRRGPFTGFCVAAAGTDGLAQCQLSYAAADGAIVALGPVDATRLLATLTVVGGTGRYAGAGGRVGLAQASSGAVDVRYAVLLAASREGGARP